MSPCPGFPGTVFCLTRMPDCLLEDEWGRLVTQIFKRGTGFRVMRRLRQRAGFRSASNFALPSVIHHISHLGRRWGEVLALLSLERQILCAPSHRCKGPWGLRSCSGDPRVRYLLSGRRRNSDMVTSIRVPGCADGVERALTGSSAHRWRRLCVDGAERAVRAGRDECSRPTGTLNTVTAHSIRRHGCRPNKHACHPRTPGTPAITRGSSKGAGIDMPNRHPRSARTSKAAHSGIEDQQ
ncbi:hypothetical protein LAUMK41_03847 [Mycobacterium attenuatum]|nr:hypothetical protein LAUMK41_03847 [Mycobacterium attenuatum]